MKSKNRNEQQRTKKISAFFKMKFQFVGNS